MPEESDSQGKLPLSDSYRKTRRWYTFLSALLLTYALIGFKLVQEIPKTPKEADDHSLIIHVVALGNVGIEFQNPNAFPWVIGLLVIFFAYRTYIEWQICSSETPQNPAKIDHHVSQTIGVVALSIPVIQFFLDIRIAEHLPENPSDSSSTFWTIILFTGLITIITMVTLTAMKSLRYYEEMVPRTRVFCISFVGLMYLFSCSLFPWFSWGNNTVFFVSLVTVTLFMIPMVMVLNRNISYVLTWSKKT